jgi:hypothetical protein
VSLASVSTTQQESSTESYAETEAESYAQTLSYLDSYARAVAHGASTAEGESLSSGEAVSQMNLAGAGTGMAATEMMTPDSPLFGTPTVIGMSESASSMAHSSSGSGRSSLSGRATSTAAGKVSTYAETTGWARGEAHTRGNSAARTAGRSDTHGAAQTRGTQDAYKPVFQDLPASFHSKEHMLYFAGQTLRSLVTGKAFINFVDGSGMQAGLLSVPPVQSHAPSGAQFEELRARILDESPSATRIVPLVFFVDFFPRWVRLSTLDLMVWRLLRRLLFSPRA